MAATKTVAQRLRLRKSRVPEILAANPQLAMTPRNGVVTLFGYGICARVDRGHLILEDGIGSDRRYARFPRVGRRLKRLVVIGSDGMVSLSALRWLADQRAAFVMLDRDGSVLACIGPVQPKDARLRRAQALADQTGAALRIVQELIGQKIAGQERVARHKLCNSEVAQRIAELRPAVSTAKTIEQIRFLESRAAAAYWSAWSTIQISFPRNDLGRVPDHWRVFETRRSPLTGSPRLAATPVNAILNYLYALLEAEARLAAAALGLDPGLGVLHVDTDARDSLACDLMEPVRPQVDAIVLDWIGRAPLRREWFFEERNGNCRLMAPFAVKLSETAETWRNSVASFAERVARILWLSTGGTIRQLAPATRLTQQRKREAKGSWPIQGVSANPTLENSCKVCGKPVPARNSYCSDCTIAVNAEKLTKISELGRVASKSDEARAKRAETQRRNAGEISRWNPSDQASWLDRDAYTSEIQPLLGTVRRSVIASALNVSLPYAAEIRSGRRLPHPRHWGALAELVGVSGKD
jgi:CRISPR-associated endonuclease Cas1